MFIVKYLHDVLYLYSYSDLRYLYLHPKYSYLYSYLYVLVLATTLHFIRLLYRRLQNQRQQRRCIAIVFRLHQMHEMHVIVTDVKLLQDANITKQ